MLEKNSKAKARKILQRVNGEEDAEFKLQELEALVNRARTTSLKALLKPLSR